MRRTPPRPPLRAARALTAGTLCGLGAVTAHQLAGGHAPPGVAVLIWPASVLLCGWLVTRHRLSVTRTTIAAVLAQLGWHLIMQLGADSGTAAHLSHDPGHDPGHAMHQHMGESMATGADHTMMLAHAGVAAATALLCLGADLALLGLLIDRLVPSLVPGLIRLRPWRAAPALGVRAVPHPRPVSATATPRGPPPVLVR